MASHFEKLSDAKKEFKARTGVEWNDKHLTLSPITIFFRNKGRKKQGLKPLKKPYFVGCFMEWVNLY